MTNHPVRIGVGIVTALVGLGLWGCGDDDAGGGGGGGPGDMADASVESPLLRVGPYAMSWQGEAILVAGTRDGDMWVGRFDREGELDPSFGANGTTSLDFGGVSDGLFPQDVDAARAIAVTEEGIFLGGYARAVVGGGLGSITLAKLTPEGALDTSFGDGGSWITTLRDGSEVISSTLNALAVDALGRVHGFGYVANASNDLVVARYTTAGALDSGFGLADGVTGSILLRSGDQLGLGGLLVGDRVVGGGGAGVFLAGLTSSGRLDASFGTDGYVERAGGNLAAIAHGGGGTILAAGVAPPPMGGSLNNGLQVLRLLADGSPDPAFGTDGMATPRFEFVAFAIPGDPGITLEGAFTWVHGLAALDDGGVLVFAAVGGFLSTHPALVRLDAAGEVVPGFGTDGLLVLPEAMPLLGDFDGPPGARLLVDGDDAFVSAYVLREGGNGLFFGRVPLSP